MRASLTFVDRLFTPFISKDVGIDDYIAKARPETKYEFVKEEHWDGEILCYEFGTN